jgi:hypothetical protein
MARGFLVNLFNLPPLIFRFQFNPDLMQEKKSFKYKEANSFGKWAFDMTESAGFFGYLDDLKEWGSLLTATKPMEPEEGEPRQITLEFVLDATFEPDESSRPTPSAQTPPSGFVRSILPDLAVLRSFMAPSLEIMDVVKAIAKKQMPCWSRPPICSLVYGGLSLDCVMTDLSIKHTAFFASGEPSRCEVSVTLKEQTFSMATVVDFAVRYVDVGLSYTRIQNFGEELSIVSPTLAGLFF